MAWSELELDTTAGELLASLPALETTEFDRAEAAHAVHYARLVTRYGPQLQGAGSPDGGRVQFTAIHLLTLEVGNLLAAHDRAQADRHEPALLAFAHHLSISLQLAGLSREQLAVYQALLAAAQQTGNKQLEFHSQIGLGRALERLGNYDRARACANQALALAAELADTASESKAHVALGNLDYQQGDYFSAMERFVYVLEIRTAASNERGLAMALNSLGMAKAAAGQPAAGLVHCRRSLDLRLAIGDRYGEAAAYNNIGIIERMLGNLDVAQECYEQSLAVKQEAGDRAGQAMALNNLGGLDYSRAEYASAIQRFNESLALGRIIGNQYGIAMAHDNLARSAFQLCDDRAAAEAYVEAITLRSAMQLRSELAFSLIGAAAVLARADNLPVAAQLLHGPQARLAEMDVSIETDDRDMLSTATGLLSGAVAAGQLDEEQYAELQTRAAKLGLPTLTSLALEALAELAAPPER